VTGCSTGAAFGLSGSAGATHPLAALYLLDYILLFAPVLSWAGVLLALGPAWWLLRQNAGGRASFAALGLGAGGFAVSLFQGFEPLIAAVFGLLAALVFRWILFRLNQAIFTAC